MEITLAYIKDVVSVAKDVATIFAAIGALVYFGYKVFAGWLLLNLDVSLTSERTSVKGDQDHLVVKIVLAKGKVDSARLLDAQILLTAIDPASGAQQFRTVESTRRLKYSDKSEVLWKEQDEKNPLLTLAAEETMELSEHFRVAPSVVYRADVVVRGDRFKDRKLPSLSQWRAAMTVLPAPPDKT